MNASRARCLASALRRTYARPVRHLSGRHTVRLRIGGRITIRAYLAYGWIFDLRGSLKELTP